MLVIVHDYCNDCSQVSIRRIVFLLLCGLYVFNGRVVSVCNAQVSTGHIATDPSTYMINHYSTKDNLPGNFFWILHHSRSGYLWAGSEHGLTRYDGGSFYTLSASETEGWVGNYRVDRICEDVEGNLWFGSNFPQTRSLYFLNGKDKAVDSVIAEPVDFINFGCLEYRAVVILKKNTVLVKYSQDRFEKFELPRVVSPRGRIFTTGRNSFWIVDDRYYYFVSNGVFVGEGYLEQGIEHIFCDEYGETLAYSKGELYLYKKDKFIKINTFKSSAYFNLQDSIGSLVISEGSDILFVNSKEVKYFDGDLLEQKFNGKYTVERAGGRVFVALKKSIFEASFFHTKDKDIFVPIKLDKFGAKTIIEVAEGQLSGYWIATDVGILQLIPRKMQVYTMDEGLKDRQVFALGEDSAGSVWIGLWGDGVQILSNGKLKEIDEKNGLSSNSVLSFLEEPNGTMLVGTLKGVDRIREGKIVDQYLYDPADGIDYSYTRQLYRDRQNRLWVAASRNLYELKNGVFEKAWPGVRRNVFTVFEDSSGVLMAGTDFGLFIQKSNGQWSQPQNVVLKEESVKDITESRHGGLWFTTTKGLIWESDGNLHNFTSVNGLPGSLYHFVVEDHHDHVWIGTDNALLRIPIASFIAVKNKTTTQLDNIQFFTEEDGLPSAEFVGGPSSAFVSKKGQLWVATMAGVANFDPANVSITTEKPKVEIQSFMVQGKKEKVTSGQRFKTGKSNTFSFTYSTLDFEGSRRREFRTRLEGGGDEWVQSKQRDISYASLSPGNYTFWVQGSNNDGVWSNPVSISFVVAPLFYQAMWFKTILGLIPLVLVVLGFRELRIRSALRLAETRNQIADDLHDDIGSKIGAVAQTLSFISVKKSLNEHDVNVLSEQVAITQHLVSELRDSVWVVDSDLDSMGQLLIKMQYFAKTVGAGHEQRYDFPESIPDAKIPMDWRRNVYFIFKEALHNLVRHANANSIEIKLHVSHKKLRFEVNDDGSGISDYHREKGRGIASMLRRAERLGGTLKIVGLSGVGTSVKFTCDIP